MKMRLSYLPFYLDFLVIFVVVVCLVDLDFAAAFLALTVVVEAGLAVLTLRFGVSLAVSKALTGEVRLTERANFRRRWLRRRPVLRGLLCFLGSGIMLLKIIKNSCFILPQIGDLV